MAQMRDESQMEFYELLCRHGWIIPPLDILKKESPDPLSRAVGFV